MAAMALCTSSCSDDKEENLTDPDPEPTAEELAEMAAANRLEAANYVIRAFAGIDALPDNWETSTFEPQEGVVVNEAKPTVRYVIVENQEEADQYFINITPDESREASGSGYRYSVEGVGSVSYQRVNSANCYATIDVALQQMPKLTQIRLVPESEVPTNAKFDGTPYYGIGSIVKDKDSGRYYICIRPSGGPNRKEYAYFVTFDVKAIETSSKSVDLYTIDNNGKKTKTKASTSGDWVYGKNMIEKRFALLAANFFARLNEMVHADPTWGGAAQQLLDFYRDEAGLDFTGKEYTEYIVPYASYKSSTAGSQRQVKYEQPCLRWSQMGQLGFDGMGKRRAACYVNLRPDAKSHNISLTDDYDPSYYYNWSKALDPDDITRWDGKKVGYDTPFNIKDYALSKKEEAHTFYSDMHHWGLSGVEIKVLLMAQKKITDKGQAYKNFDQTAPGTAIVDASQKLGSKTLYQRIYEGVQYYEITDGKKASYASDDPKEMEENPDI